MTLQQSIAFEQAEFLAEQFDPNDPENSGVVLDVLIDEPGEQAEDGLHESTGRAYFQAPAIDSVTTVRSKSPLAPGELVRCAITGAGGYDLVATPREDLRRSLPLTILR